MANSDSLQRFYCASNNENIQHVAEKPKKLSCNHFICTSCIKDNINHNEIKCDLCGKLNKNDLNEEKLDDTFNLDLDENITQLLDQVKENFLNDLQKCQEIEVNKEESIENKIEFVKESIDIKVESIKIQLDKLRESFSDQLDTLKSELITKLKSKNKENTPYETELRQLEENITNKQNLNQQSLYFYQNEMIKLNKAVNELQEFDTNIEFIENNYELDNLLFGQVKYGLDSAFKNLLERLRSNKTERVILEQIVDYSLIEDMCVLKNDSIVLADDCRLYLYDPNFKLVKRSNQLRSLTYHDMPRITSNEFNEIYYCTNEKIVKYDLEFNVLAHVDADQTDGDEQEPNEEYSCLFECLSGISCYNGFVYASDEDSNCICKFDYDLTYIEDIDLSYSPDSIRITNNVACVASNDEICRLSFYDLSNFKLIKRVRLESDTYTSGVFDSKFVVHADDTLHFYDLKGNLIERIELFFGNYEDGALCQFRSKLFFMSQYKMTILV